jgi:hypothetical protein
MGLRFQILAGEGHPDFLDLPWDLPLGSWVSPRLVDVARGISRHVVRFVDYEGVPYALKEMPEPLAVREHRLLRDLGMAELPVVETVGLVTGRSVTNGDPLEAILLTRHLEFSLPYRTLFGSGTGAGMVERLLDALASLLVQLHLAGFFWGDCSLSNTLFRRDAGALAAYLVDAETGELHAQLTEGQRRHDLEIVETNIFGELLDLSSAGQLPSDLDPEAATAELLVRYERLWAELTAEEMIGPGDRYRIDARLRRLNDLGFDVEEVELLGSPDGFVLRLPPRVVEPGHHRRSLFGLTGIDAQENQARRLLNDLASFRCFLEQETGRPMPDSVVAHRWVEEIFEPSIDAIPIGLRAKLQPAELFHQILDHRWFLSEAAGRDVGLPEAVKSYVDVVLPNTPGERAVLPSDDG